MNDAKLKQLVAQAVDLDRDIAQRQDQLKRLKARLVGEARSRLEKSGPVRGVAQSIVFDGGQLGAARINIPSPALKSRIDAAGGPFEKIRNAARGCFEALFTPVLAYVPVEDFRSEAVGLLGAGGLRLIRLCETESVPRVYFETKETAERGRGGE